MKQKKFSLSEKTLYLFFVLALVFIVVFQIHFFINAKKRIVEELLSTHTGMNVESIVFDSVKTLPQLKLKQLQKQGATLYRGVLYIKRGNKIVKIPLENTLIFRAGKDLLYLNIIFDLLLIWITLYFYIKIFADISKVNTTIKLTANGELGPEHLPDAEVAEVDKIIENFKTIYTDSLKKERELKRKTQFESLGLVSAQIIHDLKNSFTYLSVMIYKAKNSKNIDEIKSILYSAERKIHELKDAMESVLGALKEGRDLEIKDIDICTLKNGLKDQFAPILINEDIDFKIEFDSSLMGKSVYANPYQIVKAIENLIYNSIKILKKQKGREKKIIVEFNSKGENLEIIVCDNGEGVCEEIKNSLFDSFVSKSENGIGLGLSIVKEYIEKNGGTVKLETDNDLTKFIISLPFNGKKGE